MNKIRIIVIIQLLMALSCFAAERRYNWFICKEKSCKKKADNIWSMAFGRNYLETICKDCDYYQHAKEKNAPFAEDLPQGSRFGLCEHVLLGMELRCHLKTIKFRRIDYQAHRNNKKTHQN